MKLFPLPFKEEKVYSLSKIFLPFGARLSLLFPNLKRRLIELEIKYEPEEFVSMCLFSSFYYFLFSFLAIFFIGIITMPINKVIFISLLTSIALSFVVFFSLIFKLELLIRRRVRFLERDLLFALKYLFIRVKSGIPLYDALVGVAYGDFGEVSREFKKTIKEITAGVDQVTALENMALRNPSPYFRRVIWQITSNLRAGADIASTLESITSSLVKEHKILIRKYGSELNPIILMYMMFTVIIPSLSVTVVVVMSSFSGLSVPKYLFYLIPISVVILQLFFISVIKNKRPLLVM